MKYLNHETLNTMQMQLRHPRQPFSRINQLPQARLEPATFCVVGRCSTLVYTTPAITSTVELSNQDSLKLGHLKKNRTEPKNQQLIIFSGIKVNRFSMNIRNECGWQLTVFVVWQFQFSHSRTAFIQLYVKDIVILLRSKLYTLLYT